MIWYLGLVWIIFFSPWLFKGLAPIPSDIIAGMYYPWIEQKLGPVAGVPVKNPLLTDAVSQFWIWRNWAVDSLMNSQIAIWNPHSLSGQAMSPWFHTILFSPLNIFYLLGSTSFAMSAIVASQTLLSLLFTYLFIYELTRSKTSSLFGSLSFTFSSFFVGWLVWGTVSSTLAFLPLALYSILKITNSSHYIYKLILFASNIFALLSGHPQTYLYFLITVVTFALFHKQLLKVLPTLVLSFISTLFVTLPSIDILSQSIRSQDQFIKNNNYGFIHIFEIISGLITPSFFGNPATNNYWGILSNYQEKLVWFSAIPLTFSINWIQSYFKKTKHTPIDNWLISIFVLGILLSTKYPFGQLVYSLHIPLLSTSPAGRGFILTIIASVIMGAIHFTQNKKVSFRIPIAIITSLYIFLILGYKLSLLNYTQTKIGLRNLSISAILLITLFIVQKINYKFFKPSVIILLTIDLLYFAFKYTPFTPSSYYFPKNNLLSSLQPANDFYRVEREKSELLPPNMWQSYHLSSTQGYDPTLSQNYLRYLQDKHLVIDPTRFIEWKSSEIPLVTDMGVKYAIVLKKDKNNKISAEGEPPLSLTESGWKTYKESGAVAVLENPNYAPPYKLISPGSLILKSKTDNNWTFEIDTNTPNKLFVYENHHSGNWKATVSGKNIPVEFYQGTFKQINIPSGHYTLSLTYSNELFVVGSYLSIFGLLSFIIYLFKLNRLHETKN